MKKSKIHKPSYYIVFALFALACLWGLYLILWGGQFSVHNLFKAKRELAITQARNQKKEIANEVLADENNRLVTDESLQRRKSAELGYKQKGEKIIKKIKSR